MKALIFDGAQNGKTGLDPIRSLVEEEIAAAGWEVEGSTLELTGGILAYFIVHGIVAVIVIALEFVVLYTGWANWKERPAGERHPKLSRVLFVLWWAPLLSGELFYRVYYIL